MSTKQWTEKEADIVFALIEKDKMYKEISVALRREGYKRSPEAVRKFYKRCLEYEEDEPDILEEPEINSGIPRFDVTIEEIRRMRDKFVKITSDKFIKVGKPVKTTKKILCLSDLHIPFENQRIIEHALKEHSDADVLVLNGDILEHYAVSKWQKNKEILLQWEYKLAIKWIRMFSEIFPKVILVAGNHEKRLQSFFSSKLDPCVSFIVDSDILQRLADGYDFEEETGEFKKMHTFNNLHYESGVLNWYTRVGKTIFVHPNEYSVVVHKTASNFAKYFDNKEKDWECLVVAHTHKIASSIQNGKLVLEQGCCCVPMDYAASGKSTMTAQSFGYAVVYTDDDDAVDYNKSRVVYYGTGSIIKTDEI